MNKREAQHISDKIINALKNERIRQNISQYQLAKGTGISKSSILYIEQFKQKPSLAIVILIANYLKVDLSSIINKIL